MLAGHARLLPRPASVALALTWAQKLRNVHVFIPLPVRHKSLSPLNSLNLRSFDQLKRRNSIECSGLATFWPLGCKLFCVIKPDMFTL